MKHRNVGRYFNGCNWFWASSGCWKNKQLETCCWSGGGFQCDTTMWEDDNGCDSDFINPISLFWTKDEYQSIIRAVR